MEKYKIPIDKIHNIFKTLKTLEKVPSIKRICKEYKLTILDTKYQILFRNTNSKARESLKELLRLTIRAELQLNLSNEDTLDLTYRLLRNKMSKLEKFELKVQNYLDKNIKK